MSDSDVVAAMGNGQDYEDICKQRAKDKATAEFYGVETKATVLKQAKESTEDKSDEKED